MLNEQLLQRLRSLIHEPVEIQKDITPLQEVQQAGSEEDLIAGQKLIADGCVGCIIVAGGEGTRLGFNGPKGMFPISPVQHKTLFQLVAERILAAGELAGRPLLLAIMTSPANDQTIRDYFGNYHFFGLNQEQLFFFAQDELPFLDQDGHPVLMEDGKVLFGPDGNGGALEAFCQAGIADAWAKQGVRWVNFIPVDNPLADPFDAELVGYHARTNQEVTIKAVHRKSASEPVGTIVQTSSGLRVVEYSELPEEARRDHRFANISCFCFSMEFARRTKASLLHKALKRTKTGTKAWKFERFIFDLLSQTNQVGVLLYDRTRCFAPLKNASGEDSPETVTKALANAARRAYESVAGLPAPHGLLEVHPKFYYPTPALFEEWRERLIDQKTYLGQSE